MTGASWLFLGLLIGVPGYCPLTDWHFKILNKFGVTDLPDSYMKYLADRMTGLDMNASLIDNITLFTFLAVIVLSAYFNIRDKIKSKEQDRGDKGYNDYVLL